MGHRPAILAHGLLNIAMAAPFQRPQTHQVNRPPADTAARVNGMLMRMNWPKLTGDSPLGLASRAYAHGYIRAAMQAVGARPRSGVNTAG